MFQKKKNSIIYYSRTIRKIEHLRLMEEIANIVGVIYVEEIS